MVTRLRTATRRGEPWMWRVRFPRNPGFGRMSILERGIADKPYQVGTFGFPPRSARERPGKPPSSRGESR